MGTVTSAVALALMLPHIAGSSKKGMWPGIIEERVKPLWCVYDNRVDERPWRYLPRDIPVEQCTAVVYAYLGLTLDGRNLTSYKPDFDFGPVGLRAVSALKGIRQAMRTLLAVGGPDTDSRRFARAVTGSEGARSALIESALYWLRALDYDGVLLHIARPESFTTSDYDVNEFVLAMHEILQRSGKIVSIVLPTEPDRRSTYFSPYAYAQKLGSMVLWSHDLIERPRTPTCPSPIRSERGGHGYWLHSLAGILESVGSPYGGEEQTRLVMSRMLLTFSLAGFYFDLEQPSPMHRGHPHPPLAREVIVDSASYIAYHQICGDNRWNTTYNAVTGCVEMVGEHGWVSYPGRPRREILAKIGGAVLFDLDMDDYEGICGKKHALTRTFSNLLNMS